MQIHRLVMTASLLVACAPGPRPQGAPPGDDVRLVVDNEGIDAWLSCARASADAPSCAAASAGTRGGHRATVAMSMFGDPPPGVAAAPVESVAAVVAAMKAWPDALAAAARYLPEPVGGGPIHVFVVGNGHPVGDAYVEGFAGEGDQLRVSEDGERVVLLNPVVIAARYKGGSTEQAAAAFSVLSHEIFHVLFQRYRARAPGWAPLAHQVPPQVAIQILVLNEGIAHFIARADQLRRDGFPRVRADASLEALAGAWERLIHAPPGSPDAQDIVRAASEGSYWDKYGSISGMLFAYGVARSFGVDGLRQAVRCGPGRLVALYDDAAARSSDLPRRPDRLRSPAWVETCQPSPR